MVQFLIRKAEARVRRLRRVGQFQVVRVNVSTQIDSIWL